MNSSEKNKQLCGTCNICCRYATVELDVPKNTEDIDEIRWIILHGIKVIVEETNEWLVVIPEKCHELGEDGRCKIYDNRPLVCRKYSQKECEKYYKSDESKEFKTVDEFFEYLKSKPELKKIYDEYMEELNTSK